MSQSSSQEPERSRLERARELWGELGRHDSALWRRIMRDGLDLLPDAFVRHTPPAFGLGFAIGLPRHRAIVRRVLRRVLGRRSEAREAIDVARLFAAYACSLTDAFLAASPRAKDLRVHAKSDEPFLAAQREGKGLILATAHTGGWQVAGRALGDLLAADVLLVVRRERDAGAQAIQDEARQRAGARVLHVGDGALDALPLLGHLRKGGVVAVQIDRLPQGVRGRKGLFFGEPFDIPEGPLRLAAVSGAPLVPVFTRRLGYMEYEVEAGSPIRLGRRPSGPELDAATQALLAALERFVRANPMQWFHFE